MPKAHKSTAKVDKKKYRPSQGTLKAAFTGISAFYDYLMYEEFCYGNPVKIARKDCRHFITDTQVKEIKRLTSSQWEYVLDTAVEMANENINI